MWSFLIDNPYVDNVFLDASFPFVYGGANAHHHWLPLCGRRYDRRLRVRPACYLLIHYSRGMLVIAVLLATVIYQAHQYIWFTLFSSYLLLKRHDAQCIFSSWRFWRNSLIWHIPLLSFVAAALINYTIHDFIQFMIRQSVLNLAEETRNARFVAGWMDILGNDLE